MMTDDAIIAVVSAHKAGKKIEYRDKDRSDYWHPVDAPRWQFSMCDYRVAPEPKRKVVLYQYLMKDGYGRYSITTPISEPPAYADTYIRRLDETRMEVEVEE